MNIKIGYLDYILLPSYTSVLIHWDVNYMNDVFNFVPKDNEYMLLTFHTWNSLKNTIREKTKIFF